MENCKSKTNESETVGQILKRSFRQYTKDEMAATLAKNGDVRINEDGIAVCRKCGGARMFHYLGYGYDCWFPIICEHIQAEENRKKQEKEVSENVEHSGIRSDKRRISLNDFPANAETSRIQKSAIRYCERIDKVMRKGQGIYFYGATGTGKTILAIGMANLLLDVGIKVKFVEACDVLFPIGNGNLYGSNGQNENANLIAECITADVLILDNLGNDDFASSRGFTSSAAQRKLAKIIEGRYGKSTIFTSNYSLDDLEMQCHIKTNTVDRIREMATRVFELKGASRRRTHEDEEIDW